MQGGEARGRLSLKAAALILGRVHAARDPARRDERVHLGARLPFPEKRLLWSLCYPGGKHDPSVISQRTAGLHRWASALLATEGAVEHEHVARFFELDRCAQSPAPPA